ncbi:hypothetical protein BCR42DRAFT_36197 [Absidia repens]|uniref:Uncharacterized protein n=1 Tax=Absidia repens TaxID=90262 RepID=A0A1X2IHB9_9FUNG|nr:hypothetical protein BCR42DRAFT_36197 [Absidia repens]
MISIIYYLKKQYIFISLPHSIFIIITISFYILLPPFFITHLCTFLKKTNKNLMLNYYICQI